MPTLGFDFLLRTAIGLRRIRLPHLFLLPVLVILDLVAKLHIERLLDQTGTAIPIITGFNFTLGHNRGVSFGILDISHWLAPYMLSGFSIVLVVIALSWTARQNSKIINIAGILFSAGGLANAIDRLGDGAVTDYLDLGWQAIRWPTFNLADIFIVVGVGLLLFGWRKGIEGSQGAQH